MMSVDVAINGRPVATVYVQNMGPTGPNETHPDGERYYRWRMDEHHGIVTHRRVDGAVALAAKTLDHVIRRTGA